MQDPPKVFWPDKSQFAGDFKDRRSGHKNRHPPLVADERKERRFDNSIHSEAKNHIRLGKPKASFSAEELERQCEALAAQSVAAPEILAPHAKHNGVSSMTPISLSKEVIDSVTEEIGSPPWD